MIDRKMTSEERAWCAELGLEIGFDDDDEDKHQFRHVCWPYAAYEGTLCRSPRLWGHGGRFSSKPSLTGHEDVDCPGCFKALDRLRDADPLLLAVIRKLTDAVDTLTEVETAAQGRLATLTRDPCLVAAVKVGYPEFEASALRKALRNNAARHVRHMADFAKRRDERRGP